MVGTRRFSGEPMVITPTIDVNQSIHNPNPTRVNSVQNRGRNNRITHSHHPIERREARG